MRFAVTMRSMFIVQVLTTKKKKKKKKKQNTDGRL